MDKTKEFKYNNSDTAYIKKMIYEVVNSLEEKGYDAKTQLIGYLMSGDPGYISNYKDARQKITSIDRARLLGVIVWEYLEK